MWGDIFKASRMRTTVQFYITYFLAILLSVLCMIFVIYWNATWRGGFAWNGSTLQFNWHPVLMVIGLIVLYGNAVILYRIPVTWQGSKLPWKLLHAGLTFLAFIFAVIGLVAVFDNHNANRLSNVYCLHSWVGICTVSLFAGQWLLGLATFLFPWTPLELRQLAKPLHVWLGTSVFVMSLISSISGINEKLFFVLSGNSTEKYGDQPAEAIFGNALGVLIFIFGIIVLRILFNHSWQRPDGHPSEVTEPLLNGRR
ncbi:lysosomal membrane ascorbate-dependent ferrireductase CYB561A3 isoform X1 [Erpetoichthys calabaricus]|uniref:lysosomal membrane ascorbate-dependent ferrireductase CYB561A3 isoform X1 n=2 Tax=Erpetoichthys calabaricus TaxID=27687 RepID=UPI002234729D|nr:lysosomal membrane ascorbate-dependent ferrireductase CYB561A3 isoform X1 [Erpetoichthys calabaricus]